MTVHFISTVFCNARVFKAGMEALHRTVDFKALGCTHSLLWQHYPLNGEETRRAVLKYVAPDAGTESWPVGEPIAIAGGGPLNYFDCGYNMGLHDGLQFLVDQLKPADDDVVIGFDPDENPLQEGWAHAMANVMAADPKCGWLSLMSPPAHEYMLRHGHSVKHVPAPPQTNIASYEVWVPGYSLINTVCAWRGSALKAMGKFNEPHAFYGGFEGAMMPPTMAAGYWIGWMRDYHVAPLHDLHDAEYSLYKPHHVGFKQPLFPGSFADWLVSRGVK